MSFIGSIRFASLSERERERERQERDRREIRIGTDMPRGRPRKNFGLKNFGLIFRTLRERVSSERERECCQTMSLVCVASKTYCTGIRSDFTFNLCLLVVDSIESS